MRTDLQEAHEHASDSDSQLSARHHPEFGAYVESAGPGEVGVSRPLIIIKYEYSRTKKKL